MPKQLKPNDVNSSLCEYGDFLIPKDRKGRKSLEDVYVDLFGYDKIDDLIHSTRNLFQDDIRKIISQEELDRINAGLHAYVNSSVRNDLNLNILKASILNALGKNIMTSLWEASDDIDIQHISHSYFEDLSQVLRIKEANLISPASVLY